MWFWVQFFGQLFFLTYITDLSGNLEANVKLFADDTSIFSVVIDLINASQKLNKDLDKVGLWVENAPQSRSIKTSSRGNPFHWKITKVYQLSTKKHLGDTS